MAIESRPMSSNKNPYDYVMDQLDARICPQREVAEGSGVPFSTVTKIAQRQVKNPKIHTILRMAAYFETLKAQPDCRCGAKKAAACPR